MPTTAIAFGLQIIQAIQTVAAAGGDIAEILGFGKQVLTDAQDQGRDPTEDEFAQLNAKTQELLTAIKGQIDRDKVELGGAD